MSLLYKSFKLVFQLIAPHEQFLLNLIIFHNFLVLKVELIINLDISLQQNIHLNTYICFLCDSGLNIIKCLLQKCLIAILLINNIDDVFLVLLKQAFKNRNVILDIIIRFLTLQLLVDNINPLIYSLIFVQLLFFFKFHL